MKGFPQILLILLPSALVLQGCTSEKQDATVGLTPLQKETYDLLYTLKSSWRPAERQRVAKRIEAAGPRLEEPILEILANSSHGLRAEAIEMAGVLGLAKARSHLLQITKEGPQQLLELALFAADQIKPWQDDELEAFLKREEPGLVLGALELCREREMLSVEIICHLLDSPDPAIREAATEAMPREISQDDRELLMEMVQNGDGNETSICALQALSKTKMTEETEKFLLVLLENRHLQVRQAVLEALADKGGPLLDPDPVWDLAENPNVDLAESARALLCLEATRSFSVQKIRSEVWDLRPQLQYLAARCLLAAGEKEGATVLLELYSALANSEFSDLDETQVMDLSTAVRKLLAGISRSRAGEGIATWSAWYTGLRALPPQNLPACPLDI